MKFFLPGIILLISSINSLAQNTFPSSGNAGIGTGATSPAAPLHIMGYDWDKIMIQELATTSLGRITFSNSGNTLYLGTVGSGVSANGHVKPNASFFTYDGSAGMHFAAVNANANIRFYTGGGADANERLRIDGTGKFYGLAFSRVTTLRDSIVSMDPSTKELQVSPLRPSRMRFLDTRAVATSPANYNTSLQVQLKNNSTVNLASEGSGLSSVVGLRGGSADNTGKSHELAFSDNNQVWIRSGYNAAWGGWKKMVLDSAGIVRLGTTANRAALHVNGEVFTRKVKVTQNNWPDYVFNPTYQLPSLYEVESYIKQYHHLPEVPSAAEVEKEGLDLGNIQAVLLRKIEELTLYSIQQQKQLDALHEQNKKLTQLLEEMLANKAVKSNN